MDILNKIRIKGELSILGDNHGDFRAIYRWIDFDIPNLILVGDQAAGFIGMDQKFAELAERLNATNKYIYAIRGNHCDPEYYDNRFLGGPNGGIYFLKDGSIAELDNGERILFNGGGTSIDRTSRKEGIDYWKEESFVPVPIPDKIDHLITHISYGEIAGHFKTSQMVMGWAKSDPELLNDLEKENKLVKDWVEEVKKKNPSLKTWHFGHYHRPIYHDLNGTYVRGLAIDEIVSLKKEYL